MEHIKQSPFSATVSLQQHVVIAMSALLLGSFLVFGVGFAHSEMMHNAAHDGRHAFAFPCH